MERGNEAFIIGVFMIIMLCLGIFLGIKIKTPENNIQIIKEIHHDHIVTDDELRIHFIDLSKPIMVGDTIRLID